MTSPSIVPGEKPTEFVRSAIADWACAFRVGWKVYLLELKKRRRRHWFGLVWFLAPLLVVLILGFGIQSSRWADRISPGDLPYPVFIVTGVAFWQTFADALLMPHRQLTNYRVELARRLMTVEQALVVGLLDLLFSSLTRMAFAIVVVSALGVGLSLSLAALPVLVLVLLGAGLTLGAFAALPGLLVDDIGHGLQIILRLGMLISPVFYHSSTFGLMEWNPLSSWIEAARASATGQPVDTAATSLGLLAVTVGLVVAILWLRAGRKHFLGPLA